MHQRRKLKGRKRKNLKVEFFNFPSFELVDGGPATGLNERRNAAAAAVSPSRPPVLSYPAACCNSSAPEISYIFRIPNPLPRQCKQNPQCDLPFCLIEKTF